MMVSRHPHFDVVYDNEVCALGQLRLASLKESARITGRKPDDKLLLCVTARSGHSVTKFDIPVEDNLDDSLLLWDGQ